MEGQKKGGCCVVILLLAVILFAAFIIFIEQDSIISSLWELIEDYVSTAPTEERNEDVQNPGDDIVTDGSSTLPDYRAELVEKGEHIINILLIGQDRREGDERQRADTMILCTLNTREKTLVLTSFLRDTYVRIPDWNGTSYQDNRLNVCYAYGGAELLDQTLKQNFGIQVDHNIAVDLPDFENIINAFDGIDVSLTKAEATYLGHGLKEGTNRLYGAQALEFARLREIDNDVERTDRQRRVLKGIYNAVKDMEHDQLLMLAGRILPLVSTDMTSSEIAFCIGRIVDILPQLTISTQYIPAAGTYQNVTIRDMAVVLPDLDANNAILKKTLE